MKKLVTNFIISHTIMFILSGFGMWIILKQFFPEIWINDYFIIPIFFYLLGLVFIWQFRHSPLEKPAKMVNVYMLMRMIKIFASFVFVLIYWFINKLNMRNFAIIFIIFYLINLIWETYIYTWMEKYIKHKTDQEKPSKEQIDQ